MKVTITGCNTDKKIAAIKAVRAAAGMALKEAKDTIDLVAYGNTVEIMIISPQHLHYLDEGGVTYIKPTPRLERIRRGAEAFLRRHDGGRAAERLCGDRGAVVIYDSERVVYIARAPAGQPTSGPLVLFDRDDVEAVAQELRDDGWKVLGPYVLTDPDA